MDVNTNIGNYNINTYLDSTSKIAISTAILYFLFAKLSQVIFIGEINLPPFFPAIGLGIAAAMIFGQKAILGVTLGSLLFSLNLYTHQLLNPTNYQEFINTLSILLLRPVLASLNAIIVTYLTLLWCKTKYPFNSGRHIIYFTLATITGSVISSSIAIILIGGTTFFSLDNQILIWSNLIRGNALGTIIITPMVLSWLYKTKKDSELSLLKTIEAFILPIITLIISIYVFETPEHNESILYLLLIWVTYRFDIKLITLVTLIIAITSLYFTGQSMGAFIFSGWNNNFFMLQLFLFINMGAILFLKAILKEKENEENKLRLSRQDLDIEKSILKATIENTNGTSIFSLDANLNYLSFNSAHEKFMKDSHGALIKLGDNHIALISYKDKKERFTEIFQNVLKGNSYTKEEKDDKGEYWKISKSPIRNNDGNIIGITTIVTNITELKLKEIQLKNNNLRLNERVKELRCLYDITKIVSDKTLSKPVKLQACARIIPTSLQFPKKANSRIQFRNEEFFSENYKKNDVEISQKIIINGEQCGCIEMGYSDVKKMNGKNLFCEEEIKLLETVSDIISKSLQARIAEENLRKNEDSYRMLFENVQDVFFKTSFKTKKILDVSPSCSTFNGITREELIGQDMSIIYSDKDKMEAMFQKIRTELKITDYNNEITIKGESFYVAINSKIIFDSNGEPEFTIGSIRNITERKLVEENLKISEEKFRSIYENMLDVYYLHTLEGTLLDVSPSVEKHFYEKRENLIGMHIPSFYNFPERYEDLKSKIQKEGYINDQEIEFLTPSGETLFFSVNSKLIKDSNGNPTLIEGTMRNINERILNQKQLLEATEKIKESEAKFRAIYENLEDVYFKTALTGKVLDVSPSFEKHFKKSRQQALGETVFEFYYDPKDRDAFLNKLKSNNQVSDFDARFKDNEGNIIFFSLNAKIISDENGNPLYIEGSMRNINDRIVIQKEIIIKNRQLEFQNTELEQFAYIASHDLQEPLITVIHCIELLQEELGENLDDDQKQYLEFINNSTSRMQLLVKGLLDYSRIGKERKTTSIDCNKIITDVLADMNASLKESNAIVEYENLPIIEGSTTEMRQLFQNMISNANKFRKKGQQPIIKIAAAKEDNNWLFSIQDNGIGIEDRDMDKVFVIFKRLNNRDEYHGTGIGLSHCKKIIEHHGGKIWIESKLNEGSTFKWTFPIEQNQ